MNSLQEELAALKAAGLYRKRRISHSAPGADMVIDEHKVINFCSNDYLGLANSPEINYSFRNALQRWGNGSGAAHLISGHSSAHHALEEELAAFTGRERALLFSTGYMANQGIATALLGRGDAIFEDRLNHASLLDAGIVCGARFSRYQHADVNDLEQQLIKQQHKRQNARRLVMTDAVFSMDGDIAPLSKLATVCQQQAAWLMVDDAHGIGVLGERGQGSLALDNLSPQDVPILMGTLGKAFGTFGAFVAGDEALIEMLIQKARSYIYTTALPAAIAEATRTSLQIVQRENWRREYLQQLITQFQQFARQLGLPVLPSTTPIQAIHIGDSKTASAISETLLKKGVFVSAIRPPTVPADTARLRVTLSSMHSEKHLQILMQALEEAFTLHPLS